MIVLNLNTPSETQPAVPDRTAEPCGVVRIQAGNGYDPTFPVDLRLPKSHLQALKRILTKSTGRTA